MLTQREQRKAAKEFAKKWKGIGYEKGDSARFWLSLLNEVCGVEHPAEFIRFEDQVMLDHTSFIDGFIPSTHVLIEQKSIDKDLRKGIRQSDGSLLSPFQQAKRYSIELPYDDRPRWIVLSNFKEFHIFDMNKPQAGPEVVYLKDLEKDYYRLNFLVNKESQYVKKATEVSIKAGELVGLLYDALLKQYNNPEDDDTLKDLNILCVRLVFCFYAEDAGLFGRYNMFHDYLAKFKDNPASFRDELIKLFKILDQNENERDPYQSDELLAFPYVNGGLFEKETLIIPRMNEEIIDIILNKASENFDWSNINPTIFGGVFESTLNPETRRSGGMHYTSIENIHKVIDPLFMDDLREEFKKAVDLKSLAKRKRRLEELRAKMASLKFLDPAAGSGNFLTETYISLRRLENEILKELYEGQIVMAEKNPIHVSIGQFYGIEINDFAVSVARTALWIAESQMMKETEDIFNKNLDFFPLKTYPHIVEGNALILDWEEVVSKNELDYIMGNPPFIGQSVRSTEQADEMNLIFGKGNIITKQDYVLCWFEKAIKFMNISEKKINTAFVATNSICQGESVPTFWRRMIDNRAIISFAHQSFIWKSEASDKAQVHCVIVGFRNYISGVEKLLFSSATVKKVDFINCYLYEAPNIWLQNRKNIPFDTLPKMTTGSPPTDGGGLTFSKEIRKVLIQKYPILNKYILPFIGAREFLHDKMGDFSRYCFWFKNGNPSDYKNIMEVKKRLEIVREKRLSSSADRIVKMADYPYLFCQDRQPKNTYLVIPRHSSETRKYIPMGFMEANIIAGDACSIIPNADLYMFGVLSSNVHMSWMKPLAGRIKSDYRYSPFIYNNFPWPKPTFEQKQRIEKAAKNLLTARARYSNSSLADLYDELTMPVELRKAHQENDKVVMEAYGFDWRNMTESECVSELMKLYQSYANEELYN